jgi:hypothetical protein
MFIPSNLLTQWRSMVNTPWSSGNTEANKDWNLDQVQNRTEGYSGGKLRGYDRDGQWRHCDSKGRES